MWASVVLREIEVVNSSPAVVNLFNVLEYPELLLAELLHLLNPNDAAQPRAVEFSRSKEDANVVVLDLETSLVEFPDVNVKVDELAVEVSD
jgi:hypothetical protein